ncbi:hypothetical protein P2318_24345 [Myxococcaceae bacterium GXIMD 01537]
MSPTPEHSAYLEVLHRLRERGVRFAVTGSLALRLYMDELDGEPVPDCDLFLDPAPDNLQAWAAALANEGWSLAVWGEPVAPPLDLEHLRGRYYVRARKGALVMDGTYEHDAVSLGALVAGAPHVQGLPLTDLEMLLTFKRERGNPRDLEALARVERWRQRARL